jgi:L-serine dehydratase
MSWTSLKEIENYCREHGCEFWQAILDGDVAERETTVEASRKKMNVAWEAMISASEDYNPLNFSASGLVGDDGERMRQHTLSGNGILDGFVGEVMTEALKMGECNACMKRIVAAPTAGACGVLPSILLPMSKRGTDTEQILNAMYVAAGIGQVIAERAYIAGASGGCQAEIGTAAAMTAGAMVYLKGGNTEMIINSVAMALKNMLGLVCDPVAGLVEVPCVKRNVAGAMTALSCADMALAGITSRIPADEVIDAMKEVGDKMHPDFKETARGGVANTETGKAIAERMHG